MKVWQPKWWLVGRALRDRYRSATQRLDQALLDPDRPIPDELGKELDILASYADHRRRSVVHAYGARVLVLSLVLGIAALLLFSCSQGRTTFVAQVWTTSFQIRGAPEIRFPH